MTFTCRSISATTFLVAAITSSTNGSQLLDTFNFFNGGGHSPCAVAPVEFYLGVVGPPPVYYAPIGRGLASWVDGESGVFDIEPSNEPRFHDLEGLLTNGVDDRFLLLGEMHECNGGYGGGVEGFESMFFSHQGDLVGNQLDFIRLYVSNVHIETLDPDLMWQTWTANITYEFWGTPVPEPTSCFLLLATTAFALTRRRR